MPDQTQLFGEPVADVKAVKSFLLSHARATDPSTSARAAEQIAYRVGSQKARLLDAYRSAGAAGLTDDEAAAAAGLPSGGWKRCSDLRADGVVAPVGEKLGSHGAMVRICAVVI